MKTWFLAGICCSICACWSVDEGSLPELPQPIGVEPAHAVPVDAPVTLAFSAPVFTTDRWPIAVRRPDGRETQLVASAGEGQRSIILAPVGRWPESERLTVSLGAGVFDANGRELPPTAGALAFETAGSEAPPSFALRAPQPGLLAPPNLRAIVVSVVPAELEVPRVELISGAQRVSGEVRVRGDDGLLLVELPPSEDGPCAALCPGTEYRIVLEGGVSPLTPAFGRVSTATLADLTAPEVQLEQVDHRGGRLGVSLRATEPVWCKGLARLPAGEVQSLASGLLPSVLPRAETESVLPPQTRVQVTLEVRDLAGNQGPTLEFQVVTPPRVSLALSELVTTPMHDWSDSLAAGAPFDARAGEGAVTDADEWIEIVNQSPEPVDLRLSGIVLRVLDSTPSETHLASLEGAHFGAGGTSSRWLPGEALVFHPRGSMMQRDLIIEIADGDRILDRMTIGADPNADHAGGRPPGLIHEAIARTIEGRWRWCRPTPGDPLPAVDCR